MSTAERTQVRRRVHTDPRISRRRKAVARTRRKRIIIRVLVVVVVAAAVWGTFWSPLLHVRGVKLVGARHVSSQEVERAAGVDDRDNLLLVSTGEIARRVETLPWVARAEIDRKLPGTVRVRIVEREPALVLAFGAARWTLDESGRVLAVGEAGDDLPVLAGASISDLEPGRQLESPEVLDALKAFGSMPRSLAREVEAIFAPTVERITFSFANGILVRYGAAERLLSKHSVLAALFRRLASEGSIATYIDIRVPTSPAVAPAAPPAEAGLTQPD